MKTSDFKLLGIYYLFAIPITAFGADFEHGFWAVFFEVMVYTVFSLIALYLIVFVIFPLFFQGKKLISLMVISTITLTIVGMGEIFLYRAIYDYGWNFGSFKFPLYGLYSSVENGGILIGFFLGKKFYDALLDIEKKENEKKQHELRLLRAQLDPHFLFNNLNTVDSLIDKDPDVAKSYLNKLATLYRYLIHTRDDEVVNADDEIDFARSYIFLLEKRYGVAYQFKDNLKLGLKDMFLPPGALQTVLENVVKHNFASTSEPVLVTLDLKDQYIIIKNNIQEKYDQAEPTGTGLANLKKRYSHLTDHEIIIEKDGHFTVRLPVIKTASE